MDLDNQNERVIDKIDPKSVFNSYENEFLYKTY